MSQKDPSHPTKPDETGSLVTRQTWPGVVEEPTHLADDSEPKDEQRERKLLPIHSYLLEVAGDGEDGSPDLGDEERHSVSENLSRLLEHHATTVNYRVSDYHPNGAALHIAAYLGVYDVAKQLIKAGASLSSMNAEGDTPMHVACRTGSREVVELLIEEGVDINIKNRHRATPLYAACDGINYDAKLVQLLLSNGADPQATENQYQETPLIAAARCEHEDALECLLDNSRENINHKDTLGRTALHEAIRSGNPSTPKLLLNCGAAIDIPDSQGHTMIRSATQMGLSEILLLLLTRCVGTALLDAEDEDGITPLMVATMNSDVDCFNLLVDAGADRLKATKHGSALHFAGDNLEVLTKLLSSNELGSIDLRDDSGQTALHQFSTRGQVVAAQLALSHGALPSMTDKRGQNVLHKACRAGFTKIVDLLEPSSATATLIHCKDDDGNTGLHHALTYMCHLEPSEDAEESQDYSLVELLLKRNSKPEIANKSGKTCLHLAAKLGNLDVMKLVLDKMKNHIHRRMKDSENRTALAISVSEAMNVGGERNDIVKCLLDNMDIADLGSSTFEHEALMWAASHSRRHEIARLLFSKGMLSNNSKPTPAISVSWDAIRWATHKEMPQVLMQLLKSSEMTRQTTESIRQALEMIRLPQRKATDATSTRPTSRAAPSLGEDSRKTFRRSWQGKDHRARTAADRKGAGGRDHQPQLKNGEIVEIILRNIPTISTTSDEPFELPRLGSSSRGHYLESLEAAVVSFHQNPDKTRSGFFRQFINVREAIYGSGPVATLVKTKRELVSAFGNEAIASDKVLGPCLNSKSDLIWVHLPATNVTWMNHLLLKMMKDESTAESCFEENDFRRASSFLRSTFSEVPDKSSVSRFMRPRCAVLKEARHEGSKIRPMAIYMPFLDYSFEHKKSETPSDNPGGLLQLLEKAKKKYMKLSSQCDEDIIHISSTLDEIHYQFASDETSQQDRIHRNATQVTTERLTGGCEGRDHWPVLRVNQLWVWVISDKRMISATTYPIDGTETKETLMGGILNHLSSRAEAGGRQAQPRGANDMCSILIDYCINSYEREPQDGRLASGKYESVRQIFSNSINHVAVNETNLFRDFSSKIYEGSRRSGRDIMNAIRQAAALSSDIKDIRDELNILKSIAAYQQIVQKQFNDSIREKETGSCSADYIVEEIKEMDGTAHRLQNAIDTTLSLEQSEIANVQAEETVRQGDTANDQAMQSVNQGKTLMVFTVVTLVFLPMSFLSSLFALDVNSFLSTPSWAFIVIFLVSLGFTLPLAAYAMFPGIYRACFAALALRRTEKKGERALKREERKEIKRRREVLGTAGANGGTEDDQKDFEVELSSSGDLLGVVNGNAGAEPNSATTTPTTPKFDTISRKQKGGLSGLGSWLRRGSRARGGGIGDDARTAGLMDV